MKNPKQQVSTRVGTMEKTKISPPYLGAKGIEEPCSLNKIGKHKTLQEILSTKESNTLSFLQRIRIFQQVSRIVAYAHSRSIVHQSLCPEVICVQSTNEVYIAGFQESVDPREKTPSDARDISKNVEKPEANTLGYLAPEQACGEEITLDHRVDLFSLGAILYEILTGQKPFQGETDLAVILSTLEGKPVRPKEIEKDCPVALETLCLRLLAKQREQRPEALIIVETLDTFLAQSGATLPEQATQKSAPKGAHKKQTTEQTPKNSSFEKQKKETLSTPSQLAPYLQKISPSLYEIKGEIARGGLGRILKAKDKRLGRPVALKELLASGKELSARFLREVLVTSRLQHPSIVPIYEAGYWPSGELFYSMKFISGEPLHQVIEKTPSLQDRLDLLPHVIDAAEAVAYAHSHGIIHRDLKPHNILVGEFGETMVIDWGLAKELRPKGSYQKNLDEPYPSVSARDGLTVEGAVLGTPAYMPPEQAIGQEVDGRADVYALGAILYHLLAGSAPYRGENTAEILTKVVSSPPVPLETHQTGIPKTLHAIVTKALAQDRKDRYASVNEFLDALKQSHQASFTQSAEIDKQEVLLSNIAETPLSTEKLSVRKRIQNNFRRLGSFGWKAATLVGPSIAVLAILESSDHWFYDEGVIFGAMVLAFLAMFAIRKFSKKSIEDTKRRNALILIGAVLSVAIITSGAEGIFANPRAWEESVHWCKESANTRNSLSDTCLKTIDRADAETLQEAKRFADTGDFETALSSLHTLSVDMTSETYWNEARQVALLYRNAPGHNLSMPGLNLIEGMAFSSDGDKLFALSKTSQNLFSKAKAPTVIELGTFPNPFDDTDSSALSKSAPSVHTVELLTKLQLGEEILSVSPEMRASLPLLRREIRKLSPEQKADMLSQLTQIQKETGELDSEEVAFLSAIISEQIQMQSENEDSFPEVLALSPQVLEAKPNDTLISWELNDTGFAWREGLRRNEIALGDILRTLPVFSPDVRLLAAITETNVLKLWDLEFGHMETLLEKAADVCSLQFSPDGKMLAWGNQKGEIWLQDLLSGEHRLFVEHKKRINDLAFSPDGTLLASASKDNTIRLWELEKKATLATVLSGHTSPVHSIEFSPDGSKLVSVSLRTAQDGKQVITTTGDREVRIWDVDDRDGELLYTSAPLHTNSLTSGDSLQSGVAFSPDSRTLAGIQGNKIVLFDLKRDKSKILGENYNKLEKLIFSPNGKSLLAYGSTSFADRYQLFDIESGIVQTIPSTYYTFEPNQQKQSLGAQFTPDGKQIAIVSSLGKVSLWFNDIPYEPQEIQEWIENVRKEGLEKTPFNYYRKTP